MEGGAHGRVIAKQVASKDEQVMELELAGVAALPGGRDDELADVGETQPRTQLRAPSSIASRASSASTTSSRMCMTSSQFAAWPSREVTPFSAEEEAIAGIRESKRSKSSSALSRASGVPAAAFAAAISRRKSS